MITQHPWQKQPAEMVLNSIDQLRIDKRQAFLLFDQNVEHILKVFLGLPETIIGTRLSFKERQAAINGSFHELITATKQIAEGKLTNIDLYHVKFFHDVRNQLYHQGQGLTIENQFSVQYAKLTVDLLKALLDVNLNHDLERTLGETELPVIKDFPDVERAINQYRILLGEYDDAIKKMVTAASEAGKKIFSLLEEPELRERAGGIIQRYTAQYFSGVGENYALIRSEKLDLGYFDLYEKEMRDLILDSSLKDLLFELNKEKQNLLVVYICLNLPEYLGILPKINDQLDGSTKINNMVIDNQSRFLCELFEIDIQAELKAYSEVMEKVAELESPALDHLPRVYNNLEKLRKFNNP